MTEHWIGVASRGHVRAARNSGFCQLCHGKAAPLRRLMPGDTIIYYSPRETMHGGDPVQAFTAIGEVLDGEVWQIETGGGFRPFRRAVRFLAAREAAIRPLLNQLSFTRDRTSWGHVFRRGAFRIEAEDHALVAHAMAVRGETLG